MAARYWVGGTGTWSSTNTTNWSNSSSGSGGFSVPGAGDTVFFDAGSGFDYVVTIASGYNPTVLACTLSGQGRINVNNNILTIASFSSSNAITRGIDFGATGRINVSGSNTNVWNTLNDTGLTYTGSRDVYFTYAGSTGTRTASTCTLARIATSYINMYITGGSDTFNISGSAGTVCGTLDYTGFSGSSTSGAYLYGNLVLSATMNVTTVASLPYTFQNPNGVTQTIKTGGTLIRGPITVNCPTSTVRVIDSVNIESTRTFTLTAGTLDLNSAPISVGVFSASNSNTRAILFGSSTVTLTGSNTTIWTTATTTGLTVTGSGHSIVANYSGSTGQRTLSMGTIPEAGTPSVYITAGSDSVSLIGYLRDLDTTGFTGTFLGGIRNIYGNILFSANVANIQQSSSATVFAASSGNKTITLNGQTLNFPISFNGGATWKAVGNIYFGNSLQAPTTTLTSGTLDISNVVANIWALTISGSNAKSMITTGATVNLTGVSATLWNSLGSANMSLTSNSIFYITGASPTTGTRSINTNSLTAVNVPGFVFTGGGTDNLTITGGMTQLDFGNFTGKLNNVPRTIYGNLIINPAMNVVAGASATTFAGNSTQIFDSAGILIDLPITVGNSVSNGTLRLANTTTIGPSRNLNVVSGTLDTNNLNLSAGNIISSGNSVRGISIVNSNVTVSGVGANAWNTTNSTNLTLSAANSNIIFSNTTTSSRSFSGGGLTYGNLVIGGTGNSTLVISDNNTFDSIYSTKTTSHTLQISSGSTQTMSDFRVSGLVDSPVTLTSTSTTQHNLVLTGGGTVNALNYLNISYSAASPSDTWYPGNNSVRGDQVSGWVWPEAGSSSNFFLLY